MTKAFITAAFLLSTYAHTYAAELILYKLRHADVEYSFFNIPDMNQVPPHIQEIAHRIYTRPMNIDSAIESQAYNIDNSTLIWNGEIVYQKDFLPAKNDRFRYIIWLDGKKSLIRLEIIDTDNQMLFSGLCLRDCRKFLEHKDKNTPIFNGFYSIYKGDNEFGGKKYVFTDGMNSFSVYRTSKIKNIHHEFIQHIVYGNYVTNIHTEDYQYTIVGTIPFKKMEELIKLIDEKKLN